MSLFVTIFFLSGIVFGAEAEDPFFKEYPLPLEVYSKIKNKISPKILEGQDTYDRNGDGRDDLFYHYKKNELVSVSKDNNFDGKIDQLLEIKINGNKESEDLDFDGKFDQWVTFKRLSFSRSKKIISWDLNKDGKIDKKSEFDIYTPGRLLRSYSDDLCHSTSQLQKEMVVRFALDYKSHMDNLENGIHMTPYGFNIDRGCYKTFEQDGGPAFVNLAIREAMQEGLSCLANLGFQYLQQTTVQNRGQEPGVFENIRRFRNILSHPKKPVLLTCSGNMHKSSLTGDAFAIAYRAGEDFSNDELLDKKAKPKITTAPTIELHKDYRSKVVSAIGSDRLMKQKLKQTVFHELFHNLGYKHSEDIDYMYACDSCCHGKESYSPEVIALSCKICTGNYNGPKDKNYFNDMLTLSRLHSRFEEAHTGQLIINEMKRTNELKTPDPELKFYFARSLMSIHPLLSCIGINDATYGNTATSAKKVIKNPVPEKFLSLSEQCEVLLEFHTKPKVSPQFTGLYNYFNSYKLYYETVENRSANRVYTNNPHSLRNIFLGLAEIYKESLEKNKISKEDKDSANRLINTVLTRMAEAFPTGDNALETAAQRLTNNALKALIKAQGLSAALAVIKTFDDNFAKILLCKKNEKDEKCYLPLQSPWAVDHHLKKDSVETFNF